MRPHEVLQSQVCPSLPAGLCAEVLQGPVLQSPLPQPLQAAVLCPGLRAGLRPDLCSEVLCPQVLRSEVLPEGVLPQEVLCPSVLPQHVCPGG